MLTDSDYSATIQHLERASGATAFLGGGGSAYVSDASAVDNNPANLANNKTFSVTGHLIWQPSAIHFSEVAVMDGALSEVTAVAKMRQASQTTGAGHRRYTLAIGERLGQGGPLSLGLSLDYEQLISKSEFLLGQKNGKKVDNFRLRLGVSYNLNNDLVIAFVSKGYFDAYLPKEHTVGAAYRFGSDTLVALWDGVFQDAKYNRSHLGLVVMPKEYLDLSVSYGYLASNRIGFWSWGASLKSDQAKLFYGMSWPQDGSKTPNHHGGFSVALQMK